MVVEKSKSTSKYDYSFVFVQLSEDESLAASIWMWSAWNGVQSSNVYYKESCCVGRLHRTCQRLISTSVDDLKNEFHPNFSKVAMFKEIFYILPII